MGLQSSLCDVSSYSIPLLLVALIANCVAYLRSLLFGLLQSLGLSRFLVDEVGDGLLRAEGSGLARLIILTEQLNMNRVFSYGYKASDGGPTSGSDCVVCLCRLTDGDRVRKLACGHVFHKECFEGWLDHFNWSCPLCRLPFVSDERVAAAERRVATDLVAWYPTRR